MKRKEEREAGRNINVGEVCRVCPDHNVRGPNEVGEAIQPYGMEEHSPLHFCMMAGAPNEMPAVAPTMSLAPRVGMPYLRTSGTWERVSVTVCTSPMDMNLER
eukprot:6825298-Heterocapsa_arctica.AAC.1